MPTVTGNGLPFDMTNLFNNSNFLQSTGVSGSSTAFVTSFINERWEFTGTGFSDFFGTIPRAGTINTFKFFWGSTLNFTATNLSLPIPVLFSYMNNNDLVGLHNWIFAGNDIINGGSAAENLLGYGGNDIINGGDGDDSITPGPGVDQIDGGAGLDLLTLNRSTSSLSFTFDTALMGSNTGQTLADGSIIRNMERFDLTTGSGNDSFFVMSIPDINGAWPMRVDGGAGYDTLTADLSSVGNAPSYLQWTNIESLHVTFGFEGDYITGGSGDDIINGGGGNDTIIASGGVDILDGGDGVDVVGFVYHSLTTNFHANLVGFYTASGATMPNGTIIRNVEDVGVYTGSGNDSLTISGQFSGTVRFGGGGGLDTLIGDFSAVTAFDVDFETAQGFIDIDTGRVWFNEVDRFVITGGAQADELLVTGTYYNADDILDGDGGDDIISGGIGSDTLMGGNGNDRLYAVEQFASEANPVAGQDILIGGAGGDQLWGTASFATASYETSTSAVLINLAASIAQGGHAQGDQLFSIEGVIGSAFNDTLYGDGVNNVLAGGAGNDRLEGAGGNDTLNGDAGNDVIVLGAGTDIANGGEDDDDFAIRDTDLSAGDAFNGGNGFDDFLLTNTNSNATFDFSVTTVTSVERIDMSTLSGGSSSTVFSSTQLGGGLASNLALIGSASISNFFAVTMSAGGTVDLSGWTFSSWGNGNTLAVNGSIGADTITGSSVGDGIEGNEGNDILTGGGGSDTLNGGTGADAMAGGSGDDTYVVDDSSDTTTEGAANGTDTVESSVTRTLGANIENLTLTGASATTGYGNALDNLITGNSGVNSLYGFDGADILDGGAGADQMFGGNGNDTYYVDNAGDQTTEVSALGGIDTVFASVPRNLTANIENLTLTGVANLNGSGNTLDNIIIGNDGVNALYGYEGNDRLDAGLGADTMFGAAGNDTYVVNDVNDITVEGLSGPAGGIDTVESYISRNLNANFENLTLLGTATIAYGNVLDNALTGNDQGNSLYGFDGNDLLDGGAGADQMFGGNGNDIYFVDDTLDVTSEASALGGVDIVVSSVTRNLTANLENLALVGSANINGAGNALDNVVGGNSGANTLFGLDGADTLNGGLGTDMLQGGAGSDRYAFTTAIGGGNVDTIVGFNVADDTIVLDNGVFTGLAAGTLAASAFVIDAAAIDADDRIIYNSSTGALYFDADGVGGAAAIQFATLSAGLTLTNNDFIIDPGT